MRSNKVSESYFQDYKEVSNMQVTHPGKKKHVQIQQGSHCNNVQNFIKFSNKEATITSHSQVFYWIVIPKNFT